MLISEYNNDFIRKYGINGLYDIDDDRNYYCGVFFGIVYSKTPIIEQSKIGSTDNVTNEYVNTVSTIFRVIPHDKLKDILLDLITVMPNINDVDEDTDKNQLEILATIIEMCRVTQSRVDI